MSKPTKTSGTKGVVPRLRFPEFRGAAPWRYQPLREVYEFLPTNSLSRDALNYADGTVRNIHYGDIHTKFPTLFDITKERVPYINEDRLPVGTDPSLYCAEGDMVFADASEDMGDIGKSIELVNLNGERVVAGQHTILARQKGASFAAGFAGYLFKSEHVRAGIKHEAQGAKVLGISPTRLAQVELAYPAGYAEQQKIAACLSSLDDLIAARADKLAALKQHKQGLLEQLFPREGETVPRLRFPEFRGTEGWSSESIGRLTTKVGSGITPRGGSETYQTKGRTFVRSQNVGWGNLLLDDVVHIDEATHQTFPTTEIVERDVLLNISGASIGRSAVADRRVTGGNVNQHVCIIRTKDELLNPIFLNKFLLSGNGQRQIDSFQAGGNRQGLNYDQIRSFEIPLPPTVAEQQRIAACLSSLDDLITAASDQLAALKQHKQGLLQQLFPTLDEAAA